MKVDKGKRLFIRSLVFTTAGVIPYFWTMRNFIHHNPLYGLEHLPFEEALKVGRKVFHAKVFLGRSLYRKMLEEGKIKEDALREEVRRFVEREGLNEDLQKLFLSLMTSEEDIRVKENLYLECCCPETKELSGKLLSIVRVSPEEFSEKLASDVGRNLTLYDTVDLLFGTNIGNELNESVIRLCAEFLDEGQAVWGMPFRNRGFYKAWRERALRDRGLRKFLEECEEPEDMILYAFETLGIEEEHQEDYVLLELSKLHGWAGYIRWRSSAKEYYWQVKHPADLVDYLAIRLALSISLLRRAEKGLPVRTTRADLVNYIREKKGESFIRYELFKGRCLPELALEVETAVLKGNVSPHLIDKYVKRVSEVKSLNIASFLLKAWEAAGLKKEDLLGMSKEELASLLQAIERFEEEEGLIWLKAHERTKIRKLVSELSLEEETKKVRPFAQALFCIDVRSERIRRNLESLGDYETYGIAGFFGVPISFIELGKGHETYLCPVLIKPKNVVLEMHKDLEKKSESLKEVLKEILHDLKNNIFTPYITVEAIGLLFGFDMIGKTFFPLGYSKFRGQLEEKKPPSKLIVDKLSKEEVMEIVGLLQREIVSRAIKDLLGKDRLSEETLEKIRLVALEEEVDLTPVLEELRVDGRRLEDLVRTLREEYKIEKGYTRIQIEKLAKIGFTLEEQVFFVERALRSIGLTDNFGRFVFVIGHGSKSDNNPYESALDCGACGGDHGAVNAIVFSLMANKKEVRERLSERGINIPKDTVFVPCEHNTTTDEVEVLDAESVPPAFLPFFERAVQDLNRAGAMTASERCGELPHSSCRSGAEALSSVRRNSVDWTQVRPEWGLSGNYAFIVGRRDLTKSLNLSGKVFLHSYDWREDPKGILLETILSGPLVVGEWINLEHYFSTVDNETFGSGSKVYHNVVGRFGVMSGNLSDLRTGLPAQTVLKGKEPYHEPVRLITVVEAPLEMVDTVINRVRKLRELVYGGWVRAVVLDPKLSLKFLYEEGEWKALEEVES